MGVIVSDHAFAGQNARTAGWFKDGRLWRRVEVWAGGTIVILDTENRELHAEALADCEHANNIGVGPGLPNDHRAKMNDLRNFIIRTITCTVSNLSGRVLVGLAGYTADTGDGRAMTVALDYYAAPEEPFHA